MDHNGLKQLIEEDCILFRYSTPDGLILPDANPNGSLYSIAGICNRERNVFGMMPHPERASEAVLDGADGLLIFQSLLRAIQDEIKNRRSYSVA